MGGNADDSNLVYSVLQRETEGHLDYVVGTHAHEDHIGGLSGAFEADTADVTFCPVTEYDSKAFRNFKARADEKGGGITVPAVGDTFTLGEATVTVVAVNSVPEDTNNTSIVIRIVYGDTSFLFTGDAEQETGREDTRIRPRHRIHRLKGRTSRVQHLHLSGVLGCREPYLCRHILWQGQ